MTATKESSTPPRHSFSLIPGEKLLGVYTAMVKCREIAKDASARAGRSRTNAFAGVEAAAVAATIHLQSGDCVAHPEWPEGMVHTINPAVSIAPDASLSLRWANTHKNSGKVMVLFSKTNRSASHSFRKRLDAAVSKRLPCLFVSLVSFEKDEIRTHEPETRTKLNTPSVPVIAVDGHDAVAVYRVATEAIAHARKGHGPTWIQCLIPGSGDPIGNMENYLIRKGLLPGLLL